MGGIGIEKKRVLCYILLSKIRYSVYYFKISFMLQVGADRWKEGCTNIFSGQITFTPGP